MNEPGESEQEREHKKNKNIITWMIILNLCPVYTGKISKVYQASFYKSLRE